MQNTNFVKITIFRRQFLFGYSYKKKFNDNKKIVKTTKNDSYVNRYGSSLYRNKARLSVSQIFATVTNSFFSCIILRNCDFRS